MKIRQIIQQLLNNKQNIKQLLTESLQQFVINVNIVKCAKNLLKTGLLFDIIIA